MSERFKASSGYGRGLVTSEVPFLSVSIITRIQSSLRKSHSPCRHVLFRSDDIITASLLPSSSLCIAPESRQYFSCNDAGQLRGAFLELVSPLGSLNRSVLTDKK
jgi:hypothetical protein